MHSSLLKSSIKCKAGVANIYSLAYSNGTLNKFCNSCVQPLFLIWKVCVYQKKITEFMIDNDF